MQCTVGRVFTIDDLSDDDLLEIFDFCVFKSQYLDYHFGTDYLEIESWQSLVHVCRRWRCLVFGSSRRLDLQLYCATKTFSRKSLDVWPALPLLIEGEFCESSVDNVIAGLELSDRIRQINLNYSQSHIDSIGQIERLWTAMQVPLPELTRLYLSFQDLMYESWLVLPDSFLGGSAPRLRFLALTSIQFPGLLKLLSSATHLVKLYLYDIPRSGSGYISPEAMVTSLSMLTSLETLQLGFQPPRLLQYFPNLESRRPFPPTRSVLPTLAKFLFKGTNEYLEEIVARIDTPRLYQLEITLYNDIDSDFNTPELSQFIGRTPTLGAYDEAHLSFGSCRALVKLRRSHPELSGHRIEIVCHVVSDQQIAALKKICNLSLRLLLTMENLYINRFLHSPYGWDVWEDYSENPKMLDLLLPFAAVKNLYVSRLYLPRIACALQELTGARTTEALPALQNVFLEQIQPWEPVYEGIPQFIAARQLTDHPVTIICRNLEWDQS